MIYTIAIASAYLTGTYIKMVVIRVEGFCISKAVAKHGWHP